MAPFSKTQKQRAFSKAQEIPGKDPGLWRRDAKGNVICYPAYGDPNSEFGWDIDHIQPLARGGTNDPSNLRALHIKANRLKGDR